MNKQRRLILTTLLIALLFVCLGAVLLGLYTREKTIQLTLVDAQSGWPVILGIIQADGLSMVQEGDTYRLTVPGAALGLASQLPLHVSAPGYLPQDSALFVPWWQSRYATEIELEPTLILGRVLDADSQEPVAATLHFTTGEASLAEVVVSDRDPSHPAAPISIDQQGKFTLSHLAPPVAITIKAVGYKSWQTELDAAELYAGEVVLDIALLPQHLVGVVTDAQNGLPVPAPVQLVDSQSTTLDLTANAEGVFEARRLEPPVSIQVNAPGYEPWQKQLAALDLVVGNPYLKLDISLTPRTTSGALTTKTGEPLAGVTIQAGSDDRAQIVTTDANGAFELARLHPGDPIAVSSTDGYLPLDAAFNNEANLSLELLPRQVTVAVQDRFSQQPLSGVQVSVPGAESVVATDARGQAVLSRVPSTGQIEAVAPGFQPLTVDFAENTAGETNVALELTPLALQGVVLGSDTGQPLPQTMVYVGDSFVRADDNGHFTVDLPVSSQQMMIKSAGYHRAYGQLDQTGVYTQGPPPFHQGEGRWVSTAECDAVSLQAGPPCVAFVLEPFQVKGIYVSLQYLHQRETILNYLDFIQATELNTIIIDVKGDYGFIAWDSEVELAETIGAETKQASKNWMPVEELIAEARKRGIYTIGRFVVFKDNPLATTKPELGAVREDGTVWIDGEELAWSNPFKEEVWDYNIALAKEMAEFGFDEINFDYIRFPSDGDVGAIVYEEENTLETRTAAIREFITRMRAELDPYGIFVSADVFGLTIWVRPDSDMKIGQRVVDIAPQLDYLAPMVYPSTFIPGNLGYDNPSAEPYGIVYRSQKQAEERVPPYVKVRPWLQGYWYSLDEMKQLKQAAIDSNATGWAVWSAGGKYDSGLFEPAESEEK